MEKTAVIIDDNKTIRKTLEKFLLKLDFEVLSVEDGKKALKLIRESKPWLVFSDMLLPGIHGIEVCHQIKNDPVLAETKVILMSSLYQRSDTVRGDLKCNHDAFLEKPFSFSDIQKIINSITKEEKDPEM